MGSKYAIIRHMERRAWKNVFKRMAYGILFIATIPVWATVVVIVATFLYIRDGDD